MREDEIRGEERREEERRRERERKEGEQLEKKGEKKARLDFHHSHWYSSIFKNAG